MTTTARRRVPTPALWSAVAAGVVLAFVIVGWVVSAVSPAPSGPPLSSYATTPQGVAAYAELLSRDGHVVHQLRQPLTSARLPANATLVVLGGAQYLSDADGRALRRFLGRGGRLVISGGVASNGVGEPGDVVVLPSARFLENQELARGANAYRALGIAGPASRPVFFDEVGHGYGPAIGLAALPERWWLAIVLLMLALGAWVLARAVRLGGSDPIAAAALRPRVAFVEALADTLVRTESRGELTVRAEVAATAESTFRRNR